MSTTLTNYGYRALLLIYALEFSFRCIHIAILLILTYLAHHKRKPVDINNFSHQPHRTIIKDQVCPYLKSSLNRETNKSTVSHFKLKPKRLMATFSNVLCLSILMEGSLSRNDMVGSATLLGKCGRVSPPTIES